MIINFYNFAKKKNSTKRPNSVAPYTPLNGQIKDDTSIINPVIDFDLGLSNVPTYNYAYVDKFNRYYFVDDWTYSGGLWTASMSIDVLASHQSDILVDYEYVLRSASEFNTDIIDTMYPATTDIVTTKYNMRDLHDDTMDIDVTMFNKSYADGCIVFGVVGGIGNYGVTYYYATPSNFKTLINNLMNFTPSDFGELAEGVAKQLANPIQYMTKAFWFPVMPGPNPTGSTQIKFGYYTVGCTCGILDTTEATNSVHQYSARFSIGEHPQIDRGQYLNSTGLYMIVFNPFGTIQIDPISLENIGWINIKFWIDFITGSAYMVGQRPGYESNVFSAQTQFAVPIPISQLTTDYIGTINSIVGAIGGVFGNVATGNVGGAISSGINGVANAFGSMNPSVQTKGTVGSLLSFKAQEPMMMTQFQMFVDDDVINRGKPLCKYRQMSQLSGYVLISDAHFSSGNCLNDEVSMINALMNEGLYLEVNE